MSWYYYEDAREQKAALLRKLESRKKKGEKFEAISVPSGTRKLATTFWGKAWCDHLESHSDYEHRLPRGRSYLRQGNVYNLSIEPGVVTASVAGSSLYEISVKIQPLAKGAWKSIKDDCAGKVASLLDLLGGKFGDGVLRAVTDAERGLFPKPKEIRLSCTCPDHADMCKHVAAVLYGVGVKLDADPNLFFVLRSVDPSELLTGAAHDTLDKAQGADAALSREDLSALFAIDLGPGLPAPAVAPPPVPASPRSRKAPAKKKPAATRSSRKPAIIPPVAARPQKKSAKAIPPSSKKSAKPKRKH